MNHNVPLGDHQINAVNELDNAKILFGGVGTGKSRTAMAYYMKNEAPRDIVVITTARKRDSLDWEEEAAAFGVGRDRNGTVAGTITVDSWNNIGKYEDVTGAFFVFDEQRLVGTGAWVKSFYKIAKRNRWIMLSATPGDTWLDYAPVFIAGGHYKNITEFRREHCVYSYYGSFPKLERYISTGKLVRLRNQILVEMPYFRHTTRITEHINIDYDRVKFEEVVKKRWHVFDKRPLRDVAELFSVMRKVVNSAPGRLEEVRRLQTIHQKLIVFYNFDYELNALRTLAHTWPEEDAESSGAMASSRTADFVVAEWNGHKHQEIPDSKEWIYLVQYQAGAEAWNCIDTNAICFYSLTYSYKNWHQAYGRIDRLNTPFSKLFYYVLVTESWIDEAILRTLDKKESFNEKKVKPPAQEAA